MEGVERGQGIGKGTERGDRSRKIVDTWEREEVIVCEVANDQVAINRGGDLN